MTKNNNYHQLKIDLIKLPGTRFTRRLSVKKQGYQTYFNVQHKLIELRPIERSFLDYMIERSDGTNRVYVDGQFKIDFQAFVTDKLHVKTVPSLRSFGRYLTHFLELGLMMREKGKHAYFRINPKYFWKGAESKRKELIQELIRSRVQLDITIAPLLDVPEEEFLSGGDVDKFT
jgi:hypothetical protein